MHYFFKAVQDGHIRGISLFRSLDAETGIMHVGLDPARRNSGGGATIVAAAQSGRQLSSADRTGFGQCLTGRRSYAEDYCDSDQHVLLRVTLTPHWLPALVVNSATMDDFASIDAARSAKECTSIEIIPPDNIEYLTVGNSWASIKQYRKSDARRDWDGSGSDSSDSDW
ncbi:hypothetical protein [Microbulbifer halophilus]|uniref:Uncharacterized protein n=1 Tax=Microbulbifer halophilus TaxID=453963 RepID=A0ABW5EIC3_9GAMM